MINRFKGRWALSKAPTLLNSLACPPLHCIYMARKYILFFHLCCQRCIEVILMYTLHLTKHDIKFLWYFAVTVLLPFLINIFYDLFIE